MSRSAATSMIRTAYVTFSTFFAGVLYATLSIDVVVTTLHAANSVRFITYTLKIILVKLQFPLSVWPQWLLGVWRCSNLVRVSPSKTLCLATLSCSEHPAA